MPPRLVDPDAPLTIEVRHGRKFVSLPSDTEAVQRVHSTLKRVADLPAPPDQSNPIAVALCYELYGLSVDDTALAMGLTIGQVQTIRTSEHYNQFKAGVLENIRSATVDIVTKKFEDAQAGAADKVVELLDSTSGVLRLNAARMVLDRGRSAPADPMKSGLQIVVYNSQPELKTVEHE